MKKKTVIIIIIACILTALNIYNALAVNPKQLKIDTITLKDDKITDELSRAQTALDKVNSIETFQVEL